jgi:hypothetical protein
MERLLEALMGPKLLVTGKIHQNLVLLEPKLVMVREVQKMQILLVLSKEQEIQSIPETQVLLIVRKRQQHRMQMRMLVVPDLVRELKAQWPQEQEQELLVKLV